jgi:hypothetical protein
MNYMAKIKDFTITYAQWAAAGFPRRDPEWVKELFAICKFCELYDADIRGPFGDKGVCRACGCHVGPDPENVRSKLVLPNTSCPLDKWGPSVDQKPRPKTGLRQRMLAQQAKWRKRKNRDNRAK